MIETTSIKLIIIHNYSVKEFIVFFMPPQNPNMICFHCINISQYSPEVPLNNSLQYIYIFI